MYFVLKYLFREILLQIVPIYMHHIDVEIKWLFFAIVVFKMIASVRAPIRILSSFYCSYIMLSSTQISLFISISIYDGIIFAESYAR